MEQYSTGTGCDDGNDQTDHGIRGVRLAVIQAAVKGSAEGESRVRALLGIESIFGKELPRETVFVDAVMTAYRSLVQKGAKATVAQYASQR